MFAINEDELGETNLTIDTEVMQSKCVLPLEEHQWQLSKKLQHSCVKIKKRYNPGPVQLYWYEGKEWNHTMLLYI